MTAPAATVEDVFLDTLRETLKTATPEQVAAVALHWAGLPGRVADDARHLIDEEVEYRLAVAHLTELELAR